MLVWYALRLDPQREHRVVAALKVRGFDCYMPCETRYRRIRGKRERIKHPLIAGLAFVGLNPGKSLYYARQVVGVRDVLSIGGVAAPIRPCFVYELQAREAAGEFNHTAAERRQFQEGDTAKVLSGPFRDFIGQIVSAETEDGKVRLLLDYAAVKGELPLDSAKVELVKAA